MELIINARLRVIRARLILFASASGAYLVLRMSGAFTGASRGLDIELYSGPMAYLHEVNRAEGVHGRKIVIRTGDDGYNSTSAIRNIIK
jgi:hypothetical protein